MQQNFLVSIILPTHNRAQYIRRAIESVLSQTYGNIELIIIDDCSVDNTSKIISDCRDKDSRIVILKNETNLGFPKSLNKGIATAHGEYIARIDDDDFWFDPKKLEKQIGFLENHLDCVLTGGGMVGINEKGKEIFRYLLPEKDDDIRKQILSDNCFVHSTVVFRKRDWERAGGYDEKLGADCDWALWFELGKIGKFCNFPEYFTYYLKWDQNMSDFNIRNTLKKQIKLRKKYRNNYPNYRRAIFLGWIYYLSSFVPFRKKIRFLLLKIRKLIVGPPPYENF